MSTADETGAAEADGGAPDALELSVAAAMGRQYGEDARAFLAAVARLLEAALPGEVQVRRAGLLGGDSRPVRRVEVTFRDARDAQNGTRYVVEDSGGAPLLASRTQVVRGITLKTETLAMDAWIAAISGAISARAAASKATRDALRQLL